MSLERAGFNAEGAEAQRAQRKLLSSLRPLRLRVLRVEMSARYTQRQPSLRKQKPAVCSNERASCWLVMGEGAAVSS